MVSKFSKPVQVRDWPLRRQLYLDLLNPLNIDKAAIARILEMGLKVCKRSRMAVTRSQGSCCHFLQINLSPRRERRLISNNRYVSHSVLHADSSGINYNSNFRKLNEIWELKDPKPEMMGEN